MLVQDNRHKREDMLGRRVHRHLDPAVIRAAENLDAGEIRGQTTIGIKHGLVHLEIMWITVHQQYLARVALGTSLVSV